MTTNEQQPSTTRPYNRDYEELNMKLGVSPLVQKIYGIQAVLKLIECAAYEGNGDYDDYITAAAMYAAAEMNNLPDMLTALLWERGVRA